MKTRTLIRRTCAYPLCAAVALASVSCTENAPPASDHNAAAVLPSDMGLLRRPVGNESTTVLSSPGANTSATLTPTTPPASVTTISPVGTAAAPKPAPVAAAVKPVLPKEDIVIPPNDTHWTLFIADFDGPNHIDVAKSTRDRLKAVTGSNKFYIVHEDNKSRLFYGFYRDIDTKYADGKKAHSDMEYLKGLKTADGESPLAAVYFTAVTPATPEAPAEWDLAKIGQSPEHYWSLQIAAYTADGRAEHPGDIADRKTAAVESVRELRAHGVEAYYYHGDGISSVCVGAWPMNAVKRQDGGDAAGNAATINPNDKLFVGDLPPNVKAMRTKEGERVKTLSNKLEVLDPNMLATMKQFPTHAVNGYEMMRTYGTGAEKKTLPDPSVLVLLPETKAAMPTGLPTDADLLNLQLRTNATGNSTPLQPGMNRLKSFGE